MTASLTVERLRDIVVISPLIGVHLGPPVAVASWVILFAEPVAITLREVVPLIAFRFALGAVLGAIGGLSLGIQVLFYTGLNVLLKRLPAARLPENLVTQCAIFAAVGGAMGGLAAGAL